MRDRFWLVALAALVFAVGVGALLSQASRRGSFAEALSTYRSESTGARGLYLLAGAAGVEVARRHVDLAQIEEKGGGLALLGLANDAPPEPVDGGIREKEHEQISPEEVKEVQRFVNEGGHLLYVLGHGKHEKSVLLILKSQVADPLLVAFGVEFTPAESPELERQLELGAPSPATLGASAVDARVSGYLSRGDAPFVPLLIDPHHDDAQRAVAISFRQGKGRVVVVGSTDLASNRVLARGDNAVFWTSMLRTIAAGGQIQFDEFHHGFTGERSVSDYAARYGMHWAILQALLAFWLWTVALKRFGRPIPVGHDERTSKTDYLLAMARIYRQGGHRGHAARLLVSGLSQSLARLAGVSSRATPEAVAEGLTRRGRPELAQRLLRIQRDYSAMGGVFDEKALLTLARRTSGLRRLADERPGARKQSSSFSRPQGTR